jgi:Glycine rich protein
MSIAFFSSPSRTSNISFIRSPTYSTPIQVYKLGPLYSFTSFAFTSSNVTGNTGPTLSQFTSVPSYSPLLTNPVIPQSSFYSPVKNQTWYSSYWSLYLNKPGYQQWTVPTTATYTVIAAGAPGASSNTSGTGFQYGGKSAILAGPFQFTKGQNLIICVGQTGDSLFVSPAPTLYANPGRGGGGMTCIVDAANTSVPILVAAGGGGTCTANSGAPAGGRAIHFVTSSNIPSAAGRDASGATSNNAGAGWSQSIPGAGAKGFVDGLTGGQNASQSGAQTGVLNSGGFGGGGSGGLVAATSEVGGGGGGWIGGGAGGSTTGDYSSYSSGTYYTYAVNTGGNGGWSYCLTSTSPSAAVSPIYGCNGVNAADYTDVLNGMVWIAPVTPLYSNFTIKFTTCGSSPGSPPTWAQVSSNTYYLSNAALINYLVPFFFSFRLGYQAWIVPYTGNYLITAVGGGGSSGYLGVSNSSNGTSVSQTFSLSIGDVLIITVGQGGTVPGGGGGMTTVHRNGCTSNSFPTPDCSLANPGYPLLCAGGGAGGGGAPGNNGTDNFVTYTGTQQSTTLPYASTNSGSGIYSQGGRANSWMGENIPNGGFNSRLGQLNGLTGQGAWGAGGRPGASAITQIPGSGGGFYAGNGGASSNVSSAYGGYSYCMTAGFSNVSAGNAIVGNGSASVAGIDGYVTIQQL